MKKVFKFGKIDFYGTGRRINQVEVEIELRESNVFSASGDVWNMHHTDIVCGGQCLDEIKNFIKGNATFDSIYRLWKLYHLNDLHAGTKKQEEALKQKFGGVNANIYTEQCEYLKSINLYDDNGYKFGTGWIKEEIPANDLQEIKRLLEM